MKSKEEIVKEIPDDLMQKFKSFQYDPNAEILFDGYVNSLGWSDEMTMPLAWEFQKYFGFPIKYLLIYRSSLILGKKDNTFKSHWELTKDIFPNWPLFRSDRCSPKYKEELISFMRAYEKELEKEFGDSE